jgi:hypothetical protein
VERLAVRLWAGVLALILCAATARGQVINSTPPGGGTVDLSSTTQFTSGTGAAPGTCSVGSLYLKTDTNQLYACTSTNTFTLALSGTVGVPNGGTGIGSGTSGGVLAFTGSTTIASSGALTANLPVIGGGAGAAPAVGTRSGNTTQYVTTTGSQTSGDCVKIDANGNHVANGSACGGSSSFDRTKWEFVEEFNTGLATTGNVGANALMFNAVATGTAANNITGTAERPGLFRLNSHATNDNSGAIVAVAGGTTATSGTVFNAHNWTIEASIQVGSNSTAITNTAVWFGMMNSTSVDPATTSRGAWIRHDSDLADGAFVFQLCNASGAAGCNSAGDGANSKTATSTVTPSAGTFNRYRIRRATSGVGGLDTIYMSVDGETEKTFCSSGCDNTLGTDPTGSTLAVFICYLTRTTTGVMSADIDYLYVLVNGLSR